MCGTQSVVQLDEICSDCLGPIVSIPLPDCRAKFLGESEKLPPIVRLSLTCTADHLRLLPPPPSDASSLTGPILHPIFHRIHRSVGQWDTGLKHGRRNRGTGGGGQLPPPPIFCQPKKFKIVKTTSYRSVYRNMAKIC